MGICGTKSEAAKRNAQLQKQLNKDDKVNRQMIKVLLLGAGESGKSTLFKQMKLLYTQARQFTDAEKYTFEKAIYSNIITDAKVLAHETSTHTPVTNPKILDAMAQMQRWNKNDRIDLEKGKILELFWSDPNVKATWEDRGDIQVQDALEYYLAPDRLKDIMQKDFKPTDQDILRSRIRTSGVVVEKFEIDNTPFEMHDVGGQRNERRKWIHSFDNVTTVLFIVAISEYNQVLYEDNTVSRQAESVELFREHLNLPTFSKIPFILFLNKDDLFREKLKKIPFKITSGEKARNVDFDGPDLKYDREYKLDGSDEEFEEHYKAVVAYLTNLYESQSPDPLRKDEIYTYVTVSTSSDNIRTIFETTKEIIFKSILTDAFF